MSMSMRTLHIRVKHRIVVPPVGYASILRIDMSEPARQRIIEKTDSPVLKYAKEFAETHQEVGYLSDGRLSQDSYNFAGLKLQYLKKGLNSNQAELQAKRDVVKNLEIRAMELDLIQSQASKIGIPSFQPQSHLDVIESLQQKIERRRVEYLKVEKRESLEDVLKLKFQYNDYSPLTFSQISTLSPLEYFEFIKEHPEYLKVLLLPIVDDTELKVQEKDIDVEEKQIDLKTSNYEDFDDEEEANEEKEVEDKVDQRYGVSSSYQVQDYYLVPENFYWNPPSNAPPGFINSPGFNQFLGEESDSLEEAESSYQVDKDNIEDDIMGFKQRDLELERYEESMDENRLEEEDFCIRLAELNGIPKDIERTDLIKNQLKKNFFTPESLEHSNINIQGNRFVSKDGQFPGVQEFLLNKYSRYPAVASIKTLKHLFVQDKLSSELRAFLEREEGLGFHEKSLSQEFNIAKNYLHSDLSNIESLEQLSKYNQVIENSKPNSNDIEYKEVYINTVLGVTDSIYVNPINEQKILRNKYGDEFEFEEEVIEKSPEQEKEDILSKFRVEDFENMRGPIFGEDGAIDLHKTNIYSPNQLYESSITDLYKKKMKEVIRSEEADSELDNDNSNNNNNNKEESFQDFVADEIDRIAEGKSSLDPQYLVNVNDNRIFLKDIDNSNSNNNNNNNSNNSNNNKLNSRKKTSFNSFYEKYVLPKDIEKYVEYHKEDIIAMADASRMEAQGTDKNLGKLEERNQEIKQLVAETGDFDDYLLSKEYLNKQDQLEGTNYNPSVSIYESQMAEHNRLYSEFYSDPSKAKLRNEVKEFTTTFLAVGESDHKYNAAPSFLDEDKVDFRQLKLDAETESRYAKEIKEFREKDARGQITDEDSYEFTNYINFLKERDSTTPLVRKVRSKYLFKEHHNEMIDSFNQELLSTLENDNKEEESISEFGKSMEQLSQMIPDPSIREVTINSVLSKYDN